MGIKLKSKLNQGDKTLIIVVLLMTVLTMICYPLIKNWGDIAINSNKNEYFMSRDFNNEMFQSIEVIYNQNLKKIPFEERMILPMFEQKEMSQVTVEEQIQYRDKYNEYINSGERRYNNMISAPVSRNIKYLVADTQDNRWTSNLTFEEQEAIGIINSKVLAIDYDNFYKPNKFLDQMAYVGYMKVDKYGNLEMIYSSLDENYYNDRYYLDDEYQNIYERNDIKPIPNLKILFMVPNELIAQDNISYSLDAYISNGYQERVIKSFLIGILFVFLLGIFIPYKYTNKAWIVMKYDKLSLEKKLIISIIGFMLFMFCSLLAISIITGNAFGRVASETINISVILKILKILFNAVILMILYSLAYLLGTYIRYIGKVGVKDGLLRTSWLVNSSIKGIKAFGELMMGPKTLVKPYSRIRTLLGINFIIISLISMAWFFGIGLAAIYSLILLGVSRKYLRRIKEDFNKLHDFTTEMEKGNLHIELEHNLGIFSPIGENLIKVKDGFQEAVEKEVRSERMKTELISNVSHDLKTPLTSIINYVDLLKNTELDKETRQSYIKILESKSKRLQILIEDLFEASKTASGNISLEIQEIDIIALMNQILGELKDKIEKSELNFKTNFPENKVLAHLDGRRTVRVIENLIGNSIKYALPHSRVFIDVIESEESVAVTIKNISAEEMNFTAEEIVERFNRGDSSRHTEGSGLGLAISKNLVELQGGVFDIILDGDLFKVIIKFNK